MIEMLKFYCAVIPSSALWACIHLFQNTLRNHLSVETRSSLIFVTNYILWSTVVGWGIDCKNMHGVTNVNFKISDRFSRTLECTSCCRWIQHSFRSSVINSNMAETETFFCRSNTSATCFRAVKRCEVHDRWKIWSFCYNNMCADCKITIPPSSECFLYVLCLLEMTRPN
jgi:hypothetical protein